MECAGSGAWLMCKAARLARDLANHQKVGTRKGRDGKLERPPRFLFVMQCLWMPEASPGREDFFRQSQCSARARSAGDRDGAHGIARRVNNAGHGR